MKILYISSAVSECYFDKIRTNLDGQKNIYGMPVAANRFHNLVMKGLSNNLYTVEALSIRPFSRQTNKSLFYNKFSEITEEKVTFNYIRIFNVPIIKNILNILQVFFYIKKWMKNSDENKIIIYDASFVSILPAIHFAGRLDYVKKIGIFMDIYNYMADVDTKNRSSNFIIKLLRKTSELCYNSTDKYIFLSKEMNNLINKRNKKYYIMEGIVESSELIESKNKSLKEKFIIMYAGALKKEYGVELLLEAFHDLEDSNLELWIFGVGDYASEIKRMSNVDCRIKYFGSKSHDEILRKEKMCDLLVNPRPSKQEFTKYSFPSKLLEYMNSGTATLTTKLPSIPKEYEKFLFFIEDESKEGFITALKQLIKYDKGALYNKGEEAYFFVQQEKSETIQAQKIMEDIL